MKFYSKKGVQDKKHSSSRVQRLPSLLLTFSYKFDFGSGKDYQFDVISQIPRISGHFQAHHKLYCCERLLKSFYVIGLTSSLHCLRALIRSFSKPYLTGNSSSAIAVEDNIEERAGVSQRYRIKQNKWNALPRLGVEIDMVAGWMTDSN